MNQDEYNALVQQHGGVISQLATGPDKQDDPAYAGMGLSSTPQQAIPDAQRQQKVVFKDGTYMTVQPQSDGTFGIVQPLAKSAMSTNPDQAPSTRTLPDGSVGVWDPQAQTYVPVTGAKISPEELQANAQKAAEDQREREYNSTHPDANGNAYYLTHTELAALQDQQKKDNLSADQVKANIDNMQADNKRLDAQLQVSQQSANTAATNAANGTISANAAKESADTNSKATDAQIVAEQAATDLAKQKAGWDHDVAAGTLSLEQAKENYQEAHDKVVDLANQAKLQLDQQTEADRKAEADRTAQQNDATLTESSRHNQAAEAQTKADTAERAREADQSSAQAAEQARQAEAERIGEAGAQAWQNALPFMAPAGTSADLASMRNGMLSNPQHPTAPPPARSVPFPYDPSTIVQQLTAQALKGLSPTAQAIVKKQASSAPPAQTTPVAQAAPVSTVPAAPLLAPGLAGTAQDPGLGATPPGAFPITPAATPFTQSGIPEGGGGTQQPIVNIHFYPPTGGPTPGQRGSLDSTSAAIDPVTGQPVAPLSQGVTV